MDQQSELGWAHQGFTELFLKLKSLCFYKMFVLNFKIDEIKKKRKLENEGKIKLCIGI